MIGKRGGAENGEEKTGAEAEAEVSTVSTVALTLVSGLSAPQTGMPGRGMAWLGRGWAGIWIGCGSMSEMTSVCKMKCSMGRAGTCQPTVHLPGPG